MEELQRPFTTMNISPHVIVDWNRPPFFDREHPKTHHEKKTFVMVSSPLVVDFVGIDYFKKNHNIQVMLINFLDVKVQKAYYLLLPKSRGKIISLYYKI